MKISGFFNSFFQEDEEYDEDENANEADNFVVKRENSKAFEYAKRRIPSPHPVSSAEDNKQR